MIRSANWLGDAVMTVPAMMAVRETYPDAHIAVVANPLVAQLLENHPGCDEVIVYNKRAEHAGVFGMLRFTADLRRRKFDCAILFQYAIEAGIMAFLAGIPRRLGSWLYHGWPPYLFDPPGALWRSREDGSPDRCFFAYRQLLWHQG